jgi:hypothetical protein
VPKPSLTERVEELTKRVQDLEAVLDKLRELYELRLSNVEGLLAERSKADEQLIARVTELTAKLAAAEAQCKSLEKLSDRQWSLWLAVIGLAFGIVIALVKK